MATLKLSEMQARVWADIVDSDSTNRSLDATTLTALLNRAYAMLKALQDDRPVTFNTNSDWAITIGLGTNLPSFTVPATAHVRKVLALLPAAALHTMAFASALERWEPWEVRAMYGENIAGGNPIAYSAERVGTAGVTAANVGAWQVNLWPPPDGITSPSEYFVRCLVEPAALVNANDTPDVDDIMSYAICDLAALVGAKLIGRPDLMSDISARIPQELQASAKTMVDETDMGFTRDQLTGPPTS